MKKSIEENKDILEKPFPDEVTTTGNPDLIHDQCEADPYTDGCKEKNDEGARSKKPE